MGAIYIGDRYSGKTHLALELANPDSKYVTVSEPDYETLKAVLCETKTCITRPTDASKGVHVRPMQVNVNLPARIKLIDSINWLDTPGEIWRMHWQKKNAEKWLDFLNEVRQSEGILLIVPPHRGIVNPDTVDPKEFMTRQQWCNRFEYWIEFFRNNCPKVRHLLICLNKADLFCDLERESSRLKYEPHGSVMDWHQRHIYVAKRYFQPILAQLNQLDRSLSGSPIKCFITSIYNRDLLELPWIYLGSFL